MHWLVFGVLIRHKRVRRTTNSAKLVTVQLITVAVYQGDGVYPLHYTPYMVLYVCLYIDTKYALI